MKDESVEMGWLNWGRGDDGRYGRRKCDNRKIRVDIFADN
jgi:hypothetical protein